jgi:peptidoglycan hydrolase-like protein with peptidoglycan-binding domain
MPHMRVHQYRGGHDETYGGVTINIDSNWVDLGTGSVTSAEPAHCGGAAVWNHPRYASLSIGSSGTLVKTLQCLLTSKRMYAQAIDGVYDAGVGAAVSRYRTSRGLMAGTGTTQTTWVALLAQGSTPLRKFGATGPAVRRLQRALNAADGAALSVTGIFEARTTAAVKTYQSAHGLRASGVAESATWAKLIAGTP